MSVMTLPRHGWTAATNHTGDLREPVTCGWCWGAGAYLERMELGAFYEHLPVRCANCGGKGTVLIERRSAT